MSHVIVFFKGTLFDPAIGTVWPLANLTLKAVGLHTVFFHAGAANWCAHIVAASHEIGSGVVPHLHNQPAATPFAVLLRPLNRRSLIVFDGLTAMRTKLPDWLVFLAFDGMRSCNAGTALSAPILR